MTRPPAQDAHQLHQRAFVAPSTGTYIDSPNPATGRTHVLVPDSAAADVNAAVAAAKAAFEPWSRTTRAHRSAVLLRIADLLEKRLDEFAVAESQDQGKPVSLAKSIDIPRAVHNFRFFATSILHSKEMTTDLDGVTFNYVHRRPVGVAALISPWNLPLYLLTWKIAVCKPSEFTSVTAWMLCSILNEAGVPPGVVNMVFGNGPSAGSPLVEHEDVPLISFTGGTATGEIIYRAAAKMNKKLSLELGGKNANIVFADADFEQAIQTSVRSSFSNQGEICLCGSRIFVQEEIYEKFVAELARRADALVVGNPADESTNLGALVSQQHMEKVLYYIDVAKKSGANIVAGGVRALDGDLANGFFVRPTIITGVHPTEARVQKEEIFGPVVTITPFKTEDEVVQYANSTRYGLSASVWTQNGQRATRVARQLRVGTVWVNCWMVRDLNMPFGGHRLSGLGREGGNHSMEFFCDETAICTKL
ncbi:aldehyde dehydrogenase domain-containing protein [Entophlyctis helioformis]|nr:aldehyde dehydrogenase domain-containing protein [Entophlyctis helioformis]